MRAYYGGKYSSPDRTNPEAIGRCDYSGLMFAHSELERQMEYRGRALVWTGYLVARRFLDTPNAQNLAPLITLDPVPIPDARPDNVFGVITPPPTVNIDVGNIDSKGNIFVDADTFANNGIFNLVGELDANTTVFFPSGFSQFYVVNKSTHADGNTLSVAPAAFVSQSFLINRSDSFIGKGLYFSMTFNQLNFLQTVPLSQVPQ